jgi:hypothetical protein
MKNHKTQNLELVVMKKGVKTPKVEYDVMNTDLRTLNV